MVTHCPSSQVNWPEPQAVTLIFTTLDFKEEVQGSSITVEKSNSFTPSNKELSSDLLWYRK